MLYGKNRYRVEAKRAQRPKAFAEYKERRLFRLYRTYINGVWQSCSRIFTYGFGTKTTPLPISRLLSIIHPRTPARSRILLCRATAVNIWRQKIRFNAWTANKLLRAQYFRFCNEQNTYAHRRHVWLKYSPRVIRRAPPSDEIFFPKVHVICFALPPFYIIRVVFLPRFIVFSKWGWRGRKGTNNYSVNW